MQRKTKKPNIVSIRITDQEMEDIKQIMDRTNRRASDLMRDAFELFATKWEVSRVAAGEGPR